MRPRLCRYLFDDNLLRLTNASGTRDLIMNRDFIARRLSQRD
mgnify:FL=1